MEYKQSEFKMSHWISCHIFSLQKIDALLKNAIAPFMLGLKKNKEIEQFFFIRYWEKGPHIRLRLKVESISKEEEIKDKLGSYFNAYFQKNKSVMTEELLKYFKENDYFLTDDIHFIEYVPETLRYGGDLALIIAEEQFQLSSSCVLELFSGKKSWNYNYALGKAIQMHIGFVKSVNFSIKEAYSFFSFVYGSWSKGFFSENHKNKRESDKLEKMFSNHFSKQKDILYESVKSLWSCSSELEKYDESWYIEWLRGNRKIHEKIKKIQIKHGLTIPDSFMTQNLGAANTLSQELWYLYNSYMHMTNNRLGILNQDEVYLLYILKECIRNI
jgi:thiopeptide-type bacteriocin biosynthesis protein